MSDEFAEYRAGRKNYGEVNPFTVTNGRRQPRYPFRLSVEVKGDVGTGIYDTSDVSLAGCFVLTEAAPPANQLLQLVAYMPDTRNIEFIARVAHVVQPSEATDKRPAGMGLEIFTMEREAEPIWREFIDTIDSSVSKLPFDEEMTRGEKRRAEQLATSSARVPLHAQARDMRRLMKVLASESSKTLWIVETRRRVPVGAPLDVHIRHPASGESICIAGHAVKMSKRGVGIKLTPLQEAERRALIHFVVTGRTTEARRVERREALPRERRKGA